MREGERDGTGMGIRGERGRGSYIDASDPPPTKPILRKKKSKSPLSGPFYIVTYNIKWVTTSWTHSTS